MPELHEGLVDSTGVDRDAAILDVANVLDLRPGCRKALWHDPAGLHFLTEPISGGTT